MIEALVRTHAIRLSVQTRLAIIKVAEISLRNVPEVLQRDTAPKIRLNLTADIPMPVKAPKIVVKKAIKAQQQGLSNSDLLAIRNALAKLVRTSYLFMLTYRIETRTAFGSGDRLIPSETECLSE